jgi:DNA-binding transcriptional regulator YiaG
MARLIDLDNEKWIPIPKYEELYEVSSEGRVKSKMRYVNAGKGLRRVGEKLMTQTVHPDSGHMRVQLSRLGKPNTFLVYKLVMEAYGGGSRPPRFSIAHKDGDKTNNALSNLSWKERDDGFRSGCAHQHAALNGNDVEEVRALRQSGMTVDQIATKMQISKAQVSKIANYKSRQNI